MNNQPQPYRGVIVVADDDEGERFLLERALEDAGVVRPAVFLDSGQRLVDYLLERARAEQALPQLILLDLNMPGLDGREVLRMVKEHPTLRQIPIVVFTNSTSPADVRDAYLRGANSFMTKPIGYQELVNLVAFLHQHWFVAARVPA